jgi:hypothetical protein
MNGSLLVYDPPTSQDDECVCGRCRRAWGSRLVPPRDGHFSILNKRSGKYQSGGEWGVTDCGLDATGADWAWPE